MKKALAPFITLTFLTVLAGAVYIYTSGYRLDVKEKELTSTGMIAVKSLPDGATVYLNGVLTTVTNNSITALKPGVYHLKVYKSGFLAWEKNVEVYNQLVTDITAVLVSKTPSLEPLTSEGVKAPVISPTLTRIAYFTKDGTNPGVWVFPLNGGFQVNLFKTPTGSILKDTAKIIYSNGESIEWGPDEKELLVKMNEKSFFLVNLETKVNEATTTAQPTKDRWAKEILEKRKLFLAKVSVPVELTTVALDPATMWSPDEKKFLYRQEDDKNYYYKIYDLEKPLPVGEKTNYTPLTIKKTDPQPKIYWYSDSFHLVMVEGNIKADKRGSISLIRIDGSNKTEIYNNTLFEDVVFPAPSGDKIIIVTSYKSNQQEDLYAVGIR